MNDISILQKHLVRNEQENTIAKVLSLQKEHANDEGENYTSNMFRVTANILLTNGRKIKKHFIIKQRHEDNGNEEKSNEDTLIFQSEVKFYGTILQQFDQLMNEYEDTDDKLWCNLIGYEPHHLIIFDDLKAKNFKMADRKKMLDLNHSLLVMHSLGRFHALGHVLIQKGLLCKSDLKNHFIQGNTQMVMNIYAGGFHQLASVMKTDWGPEWKETAERLFRLEHIIVEKIQSLFKLQSDCFLTVSHGDFWTCNILFKYCSYNENIPCAVKFIDFQDCHINSFIFDIIEFLYASVQPEIRRLNFNHLLSAYQKSLNSTLTFYGMEDKTLTLEQIYAESNRIEYFTLVSLLLSLAIGTANVENAFCVDKLYVDYNVSNPFNADIFKSDHYKRNVELELKQWLEDGVLL